ncbi:hypothetical protein BJX99DRAFT_256624 [Aspergillus californicus]
MDDPSTTACESCRASKLGCDKARPSCMRCLRKGRLCNYPSRSSVRDRPERHRPFVAESSPTRVPALPQKRQHSPRRPPQKRNRVPKACSRCRQLKVKCDRQEPCGRCRRAYKGQGCIYPEGSLPVNEGRLKKDAIPLYKQTFHSGFHWSVLVENIDSLLKHRRWPGNHQDHAEQERQFSSIHNFFGYSGPLVNATRRALLSKLPPRALADLFVQHYLDVIEPSHQILHVQTFKTEVEAFWDRPSTADDGWLAQFFAVMSLGCQLYSTSQPPQIIPSHLFDAAQVFLQRTPFMIRPDLSSIRTLCLFVIFRQTKGMLCIESAALWPATGLILRLAVVMGLHSSHRSHSTTPGTTSSIAVRNTLWAAVILLDLRQSLAAGMPVIPPSRDLISEPLFGLDWTHQADNSREFPILVYHTLPHIFRILELATSPDITLSYDRVATYDRQIRALLKRYHEYSLSDNNPSSTGSSPQWTMAKVFFRRVLLALHSRLYQEPQASSRYPVSYWSSLDCSLALLSEQRDLWDTRCNQTARAPFFARLFQHEFFLAATTVCFHLVQSQSPLVLPGSHECQGQARRTILDLLASCRDIWRRENGASVCHTSAFEMIDSLLEILEGSDDGFSDGKASVESGQCLSGQCSCSGQDGEVCLRPWVESPISPFGYCPPDSPEFPAVEGPLRYI